MQHFAMVSDDLGKTWSGPKEASERSAEPRGMVSAHLMGRRMVICNVQIANLEKLISVPTANGFSTTSMAEIHISEDGGETWFKHHVLDGFGDSAPSATVGGTAEAVHVAALCGNSEAPEADATGCLVIRSFTAGTWQKSKTAAPEWFKDEVMTAPTKENF